MGHNHDMAGYKRVQRQIVGMAQNPLASAVSYGLDTGDVSHCEKKHGRAGGRFKDKERGTQKRN